MRIEELRALLNAWNVAVVGAARIRINGHDIESYRTLARRTAAIDFDCGFQSWGCNRGTLGEMACCTECGPTFGHWRYRVGRVVEESLPLMAERYDPELGFWRREGGCTLPRELRSPLCLTVFCSDAKLTTEDRRVIEQIRPGAADGTPDKSR